MPSTNTNAASIPVVTGRSLVLNRENAIILDAVLGDPEIKKRVKQAFRDAVCDVEARYYILEAAIRDLAQGDSQLAWDFDVWLDTVKATEKVPATEAQALNTSPIRQCRCRTFYK